MELLTTKIGLRSLILVLLVFGFAPGLFIRMLVHFWPKGHPRRSELRAELHAIEYWKRPLWVVEQLETSLCDGLATRIRRWRAGRGSNPTVCDRCVDGRCVYAVDRRVAAGVALIVPTILMVALATYAGLASISTGENGEAASLKPPTQTTLSLGDRRLPKDYSSPFDTQTSVPRAPAEAPQLSGSIDAAAFTGGACLFPFFFFLC